MSTLHKWFEYRKTVLPRNLKMGFLFFMCVVHFSSLNVVAQPGKRLQKMFDEARQLLGQLYYDQAIDISQKILSRDSTFMDAHLLLADIYHEQKNIPAEVFHLKKARQLSEMPLILFRLGAGHLAAGEYRQGLEAFQAYLGSGPKGTIQYDEAERKAESCKFALRAMENPVEFRPERLPDHVNTTLDEYWPSLSIDQRQLIFTRLMKSPQRQPQEDFYQSEYLEGEWKPAKAVDAVNTPENEGAQSLSADGTMLFFTACNRPAGMGSCDIYFTVKRNGQWSTPQNAGTRINSTFWEAQPSVSSDGRFLYFSSNRPGGNGNRDIWRAEISGIDQQGRLQAGTPVNLGDSINTQGNETSPFIHVGNRDFYFASDYHTGMGGFDLFVARLLTDSVFSVPVNLGYPVNTHHDEQGLYIGADGLTAYFSSARDSLSGLDIFSFKVDESIRPHPATYVSVSVFDSETKEPVQARIELMNLAQHEEKPRIEMTSNQGELLMSLPSGSNYAFAVSKDGYLFYSNTFDLRDSRQVYDPYMLNIYLDPVKVGAEMNLYNIYFETDSFRILPESEPELQKLAEFLNTNPGLAVEVQGHTDDTGSEDANLELSKKRAHSVVIFLVSKGIRKERLQWEGYGETNPVAENDTHEGRRLNRRTTIKITGK